MQQSYKISTSKFKISIFLITHKVSWSTYRTPRVSIPSSAIWTNNPSPNSSKKPFPTNSSKPSKISSSLVRDTVSWHTFCRSRTGIMAIWCLIATVISSTSILDSWSVRQKYFLLTWLITPVKLFKLFSKFSFYNQFSSLFITFSNIFALNCQIILKR